MGQDPSRRASAASLDARLMRRCLGLARRAWGRTSPNPMVGAVVARGERVVAEAYHRRVGGPHAEAAALRLAGPEARGATLYVNLEPCCHYGRTPPCVEAIVAAGVRRVVAPHRDPFPPVRGRGFAALRRAGVQVDIGALRDEARRLNERYLTWVERGRPFVIAKAAMTLDGRIATSEGESRWISSGPSRAHAHRLRASCDAVMVGINTALADDPLLSVRAGNPRPGPARQPLRVILDSRLRLDPRARMLRDRARRRGGPILIYTTPRAARSRASRLERVGAEVSVVRPDAAGRVDLRAALRDLARRGVSSVLLEGGGEVIWSALEAGLVDRVALFVAPLIVGGRGAVPVIGGRGARRLGEAIALERLCVRRSGPDLLVEGDVAGRRR